MTRNATKKGRAGRAATSDSSASAPANSILTINSGSSSIKFALYRAHSSMERIVSGKLERIGLPDSPLLTIKDKHGASQKLPVKAPNHRVGGEFIITWLEMQFGFQSIIGIGHRVVHGGPKFTSPQRLTRELVHELNRLSPYDPEHLPSSLELMGLFHKQHPQVPQGVCFDTAFHSQ